MTMFVRPARPDDAEFFVKWATKYYDPKTATLTLCVYKEDKIVAYLPIEDSYISTQVLDSIVINPEATNLEVAEAMRELIKHAVFVGYIKKTDYIYFIGDHPETNKLAERVFEKVEFPIYRLNIKDLEHA
jgi:hypothetical protein